jgi:hypothetical protein
MDESEKWIVPNDTRETAVVHWKAKLLPALVIALSMTIAALAGCVDGLFRYFGIFW